MDLQLHPWPHGHDRHQEMLTYYQNTTKACTKALKNLVLCRWA